MAPPARERAKSRIVVSAARLARVIVAASFSVLVVACTQTKTFLSESEIPERSGTLRVLLKPSDVEVSELTAAGLSEPNAVWTASAKTNIETALDAIMEAKDAWLVRYRAAVGELANDEALQQALKLHSAVGAMILVHKYIPAMALPTKKDKFDWSMGKAATVLRRSFDADYALFVYFRDSFASSGRVAVILIGALFGVGVQGGSQIGFASLVDLRSGQIVWFNRLFKDTGDLRKPDSARGATESLLIKLPL
jgi:hypothetical protein